MRKKYLSDYNMAAKTVITAILLSMLYHPVFAQVTLPQIQNIGIVSPDAASIEKFGNIPVGYSTGVPDIAIPVYQIKAGRISLPISLNYHAGGIRVNDVASSVGLGWALNAGGIVTRNMIGRPDEINGYLSTPSESDIVNNPGNYFTFLYNANSLSDFEPDIFSFSAGDQSGKFLFNKDQSVFQIPLSDNKIEFIQSGTQTSFKITDKNGIIYYFEGMETQYAQVSPITPYTSAWRLTRIVDPITNQTVTLTYQQTTSESEVTEDDQASLTNIPQDNGITCGMSTPTNNLLQYNSTAIYHPSSLYLQTITWDGGKIDFLNTNDRTDRQGGLRCQQIQISSFFNGSYQPLKKIQLNQSYFYYNSTAAQAFPFSNSDQRNYRMRLDAVGFVSLSGSNPPQYYRMTYDPTLMASRESYGQDIWGFNNGAFGNTSLLPVEQAFDSNGTSYTVGNANRNTNAAYINACSLQSIQYPTGGKSVFTLEPHVYQDYNTTTNQTLPCSITSGNGPTSSTTPFIVNSSYQDIRYSVSISAYDFNASKTPPSITLIDQTANTQSKFTSSDNTRIYTTGIVTYKLNGLSFITGHTYSIVVDIGSNTNATGQVTAQFTLYWQNTTGSPAYKSGGGLRVKNIANYDSNGNFINKETYKYGITGEEGYGMLMTYPSWLGPTRSVVYYRKQYTGAGCGNAYNDAPISYIYHSNVLTSVSTVSGSPVLYPYISKHITSADESTNIGKTIYTYNVVPDAVLTTYPFDVSVLSNDWQNNFLTSETTFKNVSGIFSPVLEKDYHYQLDRQQYKYQLKIIKNFTIVGGNEIRTPQSVTAYQSYPYPTMPDFTFNTYQRLTGAMLLHDVKTTTWTDAGNLIVTEGNYYDSPNHLQLTQKTLTDSKGDLYQTQYKYAHDFSGSQPYNDMVNTLHLWSPVVEELENVTKTVNNTATTSFITGKKTDYLSWNGNSAEIYPATVSTKKGSAANVYDPRVQYDTYDDKGNPVTLSQSGGSKVSYQWGYNGQYPVATILNAQNTSVNSTQPVVGNGTLAVSSGGSVTFTTLTSGNITLALRLTSPPTRSFSVTFMLNSSSPDTFCFQLGGSPSVCGGSAHSTSTLTNMPAGTYTLSISSIFDTSPNNPSPLFATIDFSYPSSQIVTTGIKEFFYESFEEGTGNSTTNDARTGHFSYSGSYSKTLSGLSSRNYILSYWQKTANGWTLQKQQPVAVTGGSYTISIPAGQIDDVRFYPVDAQMTTYTYDPLVGMTSVTDPKDKTTYYEYDDFQRLIDTKDKNRNVVKHTEYHYQAQ